MNKLLRSGLYLRLLPWLPQLPSVVRLGWRLFRDRRVPNYLKSMVILALLYAVSPLDIIPDFFVPGIGYLDDVTVLLLMAYSFIRLSPADVVAEHVGTMGGRFQRTFQRWLSGLSSASSPFPPLV